MSNDSTWLPVKRKEVCEAYIPDAGDQISTLNGVETANEYTIVVRQKHSDGDEWHTFITDVETFNNHYDWEDDQDSDEVIAEEDESDKQSEKEALEEKFWGMLKPELIKECDNRELDHSGIKEELVDRLVTYELNKQ